MYQATHVPGTKGVRCWLCLRPKHESWIHCSVTKNQTCPHIHRELFCRHFEILAWQPSFSEPLTSTHWRPVYCVTQHFLSNICDSALAYSYNSHTFSHRNSAQWRDIGIKQRKWNIFSRQGLIRCCMWRLESNCVGSLVRPDAKNALLWGLRNVKRHGHAQNGLFFGFNSKPATSFPAVNSAPLQSECSTLANARRLQSTLHKKGSFGWKTVSWDKYKVIIRTINEKLRF